MYIYIYILFLQWKCNVPTSCANRQTVLMNMMWLRVSVLECTEAYKTALHDWICNSSRLYAGATMTLKGILLAFKCTIPNWKVSLFTGECWNGLEEPRYLSYCGCAVCVASLGTGYQQKLVWQYFCLFIAEWWWQVLCYQRLRQFFPFAYQIWIYEFNK